MRFDALFHRIFLCIDMLLRISGVNNTPPKNAYKQHQTSIGNRDEPTHGTSHDTVNASYKCRTQATCSALFVRRGGEFQEQYIVSKNPKGNAPKNNTPSGMRVFGGVLVNIIPPREKYHALWPKRGWGGGEHHAYGGRGGRGSYSTTITVCYTRVRLSIFWRKPYLEQLPRRRQYVTLNHFHGSILLCKACIKYCCCPELSCKFIGVNSFHGSSLVCRPSMEVHWRTPLPL